MLTSIGSSGGWTGWNQYILRDPCTAVAESQEWAGHAAAGKQTAHPQGGTYLSAKQQCTMLSFSV